MRSFTSRRFREVYALLPEHIRRQVRRSYHVFQQNPSHPGLNFKKVEAVSDIYSARVGLGYRALGKRDGTDIVWFWIGPHSEYDKLIRM